MWIDYVALGLMAICGPYGFYTTYKYKKIKEIENRLPDFLRDVAEAGRFGMTLAEAIKVSSRGRYGGLTPEIQPHGGPDRLGCAGGRGDEAVRRASRHPAGQQDDVDHHQGQRCRRQRRRRAHHGRARCPRDHAEPETSASIAMSTYTVVIYVAFMVFIATIFILNTTFLPKMAEAGAQVAAGAEAAAYHQHASHHQDRCHPADAADIRHHRGHTRLRRRHSCRRAAGRAHRRTACAIRFIMLLIGLLGTRV